VSVVSAAIVVAETSNSVRRARRNSRDSPGSNPSSSIRARPVRKAKHARCAKAKISNAVADAATAVAATAIAAGATSVRGSRAKPVSRRARRLHS
jgi:hypothetical protein